MDDSNLAQKNKEQLPKKPITSLAKPLGFINPITIKDNSSLSLEEMNIFAGEVLKDPLLLQQVCERVYELMLEDLSQHQTTRIF
jgi:hypothetical protein